MDFWNYTVSWKNQTATINDITSLIHTCLLIILAHIETLFNSQFTKLKSF